MFQAIIWDFDGTLVDTYPEIARAVNAALATFGKTATLERVTELACISLDYCLSELSKEFAIAKEVLDEQFALCYATVKPEEQKPFPNVVDVCNKVQELDGQNFIVTHRRRKSLNVLLEGHQMLPYFTDIVAGDDGFPRKPDPSAILHLINKHQLWLDKILVVGDRDLDIRAGQSAGVKTCLFRASFPDLSPDFRIDDFSELLNLL